MSAIRELAGRWWIVLAGVFLLLTGISLLFGVSIPVVIMGVLAIVAGIFALLAS